MHLDETGRCNQDKGRNKGHRRSGENRGDEAFMMKTRTETKSHGEAAGRRKIKKVSLTMAAHLLELYPTYLRRHRNNQIKI